MSAQAGGAPSGAPPPSVAERDAQAIKALEAAAAKIREALDVMPNHVDSGFDPRNDVPTLRGALARVDDVARWAKDGKR